jgi:hypothetical protein
LARYWQRRWHNRRSCVQASSTSLRLRSNQHVETKWSFELIGLDHRWDHAPTTNEVRMPIRSRLDLMHHPVARWPWSLIPSGHHPTRGRWPRHYRNCPTCPVDSTPTLTASVHRFDSRSHAFATTQAPRGPPEQLGLEGCRVIVQTTPWVAPDILERLWRLKVRVHRSTNGCLKWRVGYINIFALRIAT